jgi:hypothetical protein
MVMCSRQSSRCRAMRCYANPFPSFPSILAPSWLCFCVTRVGLLVVKRRLGQHRITTYEVIRIAEVKGKRITNRNVYSWGITVQVSSRRWRPRAWISHGHLCFLALVLCTTNTALTLIAVIIALLPAGILGPRLVDPADNAIPGQR